MEKKEADSKKIPSKEIMKELRQFGSYHSFPDMIKILDKMEGKVSGEENP